MILFLLVFTRFTFSQIVNIENQRLSGNKNGFSGSIEFGLNIIKNANMFYYFSNRNKALYKKDAHSLMFIGDISLVKAAGADLVNSGFEHIRYSYNLKKYHRIFFETFQQMQYNRVQLINMRALLGTGARAEIIKYDSASVNTGAFIMGEYEEQTDHKVNMTFRYSCFLSFDFQFNKSTGINSITYYQPDFLDPADFRVSSETSVRVSINQKLSLRLVYNLIYDSRPVPSVPSTIYGLSNTISYRF